MNNIEKALKIIYNNLPYKYHIPVKIYKTARGASQAQAKEGKKDYKKVLKFYTKYFKSPPVSNYMKTKYYTSESNNKNYFLTGLDVAGIGSYPIKLVEQNLKMKTLEHLTFMILHEIGHQVLISGYNYDERACDLFAIRWIRKLVDKNVIKKYWRN